MRGKTIDFFIADIAVTVGVGLVVIFILLSLSLLSLLTTHNRYSLLFVVHDCLPGTSASCYTGAERKVGDRRVS